MNNNSFMTTKTEHSADTYKSHSLSGHRIHSRNSKGDEDKSARSSTANESFDYDDDISLSITSQSGLLNSSNSVNNSYSSSAHISHDHLRSAKHLRSKSTNSSSSSHPKPVGFSAMSIPLYDVEENEVLNDIIPSDTIPNNSQGKFHAFKACIPTHKMKKKHKIPTFNSSPHESAGSYTSPYTQYGSSIVVENDYTQILFQPRQGQEEHTNSTGIQSFSPHQKQMTESAAKNWKDSSPTANNGVKSEITSDQQFLNTLAQALSNNYEQLQKDLYKLTGKTELQRLVDERNMPDVPQVLTCNIEDESDLVSEFGMGSTSGGKYNDHASVVRGMEREYNYSQRYRNDYGPRRSNQNYPVSRAGPHEDDEVIEGNPYHHVPTRLNHNYKNRSSYRGAQSRSNRRMTTLQEDVDTVSEDVDIIDAFGKFGTRKTPLTLSEAFDDFGLDEVLIKGKSHRNNTFDFSVDDEEDIDNGTTNMHRPSVYSTSAQHRTKHDSYGRVVSPTYAGTQSRKKIMSPSEESLREERRAQILMSNAERMSNCGSSISSGASPFNLSQKYVGRLVRHDSIYNNRRMKSRS